jgi:hypothetical protein
MTQLSDTIEPPVDEAGATGEPGASTNLFDHFDGVGTTEPADGATVAPPVDEAAEAAAARERAATSASAIRPQTNYYDQFDSDHDAGEVSLEERMRLSAKDGYYRGTIAGAAELRRLVQAGQDNGWPADIKQQYENIVADLIRHDLLRPPNTAAEAAAVLAGQTMVGAPHAAAETGRSPPTPDERQTPYVAELFARNAPTLGTPQEPQWPSVQGDDPFATAARRNVRSVQSDRGPGRSGSVELVTGLANYADDLAKRMFEASENRRLGGDFNPKPFVEFAGNMVGIGGPYAMISKPGVGAVGGRMPPRGLPMDEASRLRRSKAQGYEDTPFFRGERAGDAPVEYPTGGHFSRSKEVADRYAQAGGLPEAREFRLKTDRAFRDYDDLTLEQYARLVRSAKEIDPPLAARLTDLVAQGKSVDWLLRYAKNNPDDVVVKGGHTAMIRKVIEDNAKAPKRVFMSAGFDALDSGRDVRKLSGDGIRLKDAAFDPRRVREQNVLASILGLSALPLAAAKVGPGRE